MTQAPGVFVFFEREACLFQPESLSEWRELGFTSRVVMILLCSTAADGMLGCMLTARAWGSLGSHQPTCAGLSQV